MDEMKLDQVCMAHESRVLRGMERKFKHKRRTRGHKSNFPIWEMKREGCYNERMALRKESRLLGLARGYLNFRAYREIEQTVREGNEVSVSDLMDTLEHYGYTFPEYHVAAWLNEEAA